MARILIIDDEEVVRFTVRKLLEKHDHEVVEARTGIEGVSLFQANEIDLVVTDIIMPDKEGLETIREIRSLDDKVKIIAVSGGGRIGPDSFLAMAERLGANKTFTKPFDMADFVAAVDRLLLTGRGGASSAVA